ncbi:hypothetical protein [Pararhodobacter zhoushanensis]|uniref:Uncharacterized protein n=1 Tax=Pararhodobacter zhoushanensis TaxID=2479545 RepID=A0ABT3H2Z5_9RHOB|nr:hypothetical protein [Pararhodobacter zhoushanensis]MCW1934078.1 hypothetical protein [Pararhodobacter zhoushanensis]
MPSDVKSTLRALGLALLNATLLLVVVALIAAAVLVWQMRGLAADVRGGVQAELVAIQTQVQSTRETARETLAVLQDARSTAPELAEARARLAAVVARLEALEAPADTDAGLLWRQVARAVFETLAQNLPPRSAAPRQ